MNNPQSFRKFFAVYAPALKKGRGFGVKTIKILDMDNNEVVEKIKQLPVDEQIKAYESINPEAFLLQLSIEEKKKQIMEGKYYEKG